MDRRRLVDPWFVRSDRCSSRPHLDGRHRHHSTARRRRGSRGSDRAPNDPPRRTARPAGDDRAVVRSGAGAGSTRSGRCPRRTRRSPAPGAVVVRRTATCPRIAGRRGRSGRGRVAVALRRSVSLTIVFAVRCPALRGAGAATVRTATRPATAGCLRPVPGRWPRATTSPTSTRRLRTTTRHPAPSNHHQPNKHPAPSNHHQPNKHPAPSNHHQPNKHPAPSNHHQPNKHPAPSNHHRASIRHRPTRRRLPSVRHRPAGVHRHRAGQTGSLLRRLARARRQVTTPPEGRSTPA